MRAIQIRPHWGSGRKRGRHREGANNIALKGGGDWLQILNSARFFVAAVFRVVLFPDPQGHVKEPDADNEGGERAVAGEAGEQTPEDIRQEQRPGKRQDQHEEFNAVVHGTTGKV